MDTIASRKMLAQICAVQQHQSDLWQTIADRSIMNGHEKLQQLAETEIEKCEATIAAHRFTLEFVLVEGKQ